MSKKFHSLKDYLELLKENDLLLEHNIKDDNEQIIHYLSFNSNDVKGDTLFVCKGSHFDVNYLNAAIEKGAVCYISEKKYNIEETSITKKCDYIIVNDIRKTMAIIGDYYYNKPWEKLVTVGITGTKGKSTTAYFMRNIFDNYLYDNKMPLSAIISGIDNYDGIINEESHLTTPEAMELHKHFNNAVKSGISHLSMEVSSQALKYDRTLGVKFDVGCFLNIGEDHISDIEHDSFEDYLKSKLILFSQCKRACINLESDHVERVLEAAKVCPEVYTFGFKESADFYGFDIERKNGETKFKVKSESGIEDYSIEIAGLFNVQNALAAIAISKSLEIPYKNIAEGLKTAKVSGRMEVYWDKAKKVQAIVDYAHNQMSFQTLFDSTKKEYPDKKLSIVFGCPGKKALGRRKELGEIAGKYADAIYLTEEDAGEEPVLKICEEIAQNVAVYNSNYEIILDREEAIKKAISDADENTILLITGKGRETRQKRGNAYIDTPSDVDYVCKYLAEKNI